MWSCKRLGWVEFIFGNNRELTVQEQAQRRINNMLGGNLEVEDRLGNQRRRGQAAQAQHLPPNQILSWAGYLGNDMGDNYQVRQPTEEEIQQLRPQVNQFLFSEIQMARVRNNAGTRRRQPTLAGQMVMIRGREVRHGENFYNITMITEDGQMSHHEIEEGDLDRRQAVNLNR